ncbi:MAG: type VI secretion system baseplate subunit TssF, partial [Calditrichaeota bacterium]
MNEVKYFEREYNFLHSAGEEFGRKHADIGRMLNLDDRQRKDPFVERLCEAFAFLSGRIHERLDDDIPEFAGALLEQLFPQFLRPFPSCAILEADTMTGAITKPVFVPRGKEVQTRAGQHLIEFKVATATTEKRTEVVKESVEFIFRTVQDFTIYPMKLNQVRLESTSDGNSALIMQCQLNRNVNFEALDLKKLTLYLFGDNRLRYTLLLYLLKYTHRIDMRELGGDQKFHQITPFRIFIPELSPEFDQENDKAILPYARQTFSGYRLLHEYFSFADKFFFIDILGLNQFQASKEGHPFEIRFAFNRPLSTEWRPTEKNIRLNCVPIVNLFQQQTEPMHVNRRMPEYYVIPDADRKKSREIYSIDNVTGVDRNKKSRYTYTPITTYKILDIKDTEYEFMRFFSTAFRPQPAEMNETYIRLFGPS